MAKKKTEEKPEEVIEEVIIEATTPKAEPKAKKFKQKAKGMFWKRPTHFHKFGTVVGEVTAEQEEEFMAVTPKETDIKKWVLDYDPIAKRLAEAKKKARARAGLPEEK